MNEQMFYIWLGWFFFAIIPLVIYANYSFIKKSGLAGKELWLKLIFPFSLIKVDKSKDYRKEFIVMYVLIVVCVIWFVFPFFVTGTFDASFLKK